MEPIVSHKRSASDSMGAPFKKQHTEKLSIEERVDEVCHNLMSAYNNGHFTISKKGDEAWKVTLLFDFIKRNPNESNIWDLVFKKFAFPSITIPFAHGLSCTLPSALWERHTEFLLKDLSSEGKDDIAPEVIQTFIQCLQACSSLNLLTEENWPYIMKLAKKHSIYWLFTECMDFGLNGKDFFRDICNLKFKDFQELMGLISKSPLIDAHLSVLIPLLYPSEKDNEECTFCFSHGQKAKLPLYLWKEHSAYFWNLANFKKEESYNLQDNEISQKSVETFVRCLTRCTSHNLINLENYVELAELASKYQVTWLLNDCEEFFKVYTLSQAAQCQFAKTTKDYIAELIRNKTPVKAKDALDKLADQYRLLALKLYANGFSLDILSDGTLLIEMPDDSIKRSLLQPCLAMENPWDAPKIELQCFNFSSDFDEEDFKEISKIAETIKCPFIVRLDYHTAPLGKRVPLCDMLNKYPNIKHLKIVIGREGNIEGILEMIRKNVTLESLDIIVHDCDYLRENEKNFTEDNLNVAIQKALEENKHIKKIPLRYAEYLLDSTRSYTKSYTSLKGPLISNYEITAQEIDWLY